LRSAGWRYGEFEEETMSNLRTVSIAVIVGVVGLALVAGAAGKASVATRVRHLQAPIEALALDGSRIAYDVGSTTTGGKNKVLVWNVHTGWTRKVSGPKTAAADSTSTGSGVLQVALAGSRVAWLVNEGGNLEGDDYLFTSSTTKSKERQVATETRTGDACSGGPSEANPGCAGTWLGGVVGAGKLIAVNRWTTDSGGAVSGGGLYVLDGSKLKQIATGADTVKASAVDGGRVAVLRSDGKIGLYSSSGTPLRTVSPSNAVQIALSGHELVVLTSTRSIDLYDTRTGSLQKTLPVHGQAKRMPGNLDVQGEVAIYTMNTLHASPAQGVVRAVNLSSGADHIVGKLRGTVTEAQIDKAGLAYAGNGYGSSYGKGTVVFKPFERIAAAVGGASTTAAGSSGTSVTCRVHGRTTVTGIPDSANHLRFRFWYSSRPVYTSIWVWYAPSLSHGKSFIRTQGHPTRAMAILHLKTGHLMRVGASCH
jgi:hypothetical protein